MDSQNVDASTAVNGDIDRGIAPQPPETWIQRAPRADPAPPRTHITAVQRAPRVPLRTHITAAAAHPAPVGVSSANAAPHIIAAARCNILGAPRAGAVPGIAAAARAVTLVTVDITAATRSVPLVAIPASAIPILEPAKIGCKIYARTSQSNANTRSHVHSHPRTPRRGQSISDSTSPPTNSIFGSPHGSNASTAPSDVWDDAPANVNNLEPQRTAQRGPDFEKHLELCKTLFATKVLNPEDDLVVVGFGNKTAAERYSKELRSGRWARRKLRVLVARELLALVCFTLSFGPVY